MTSSAAEAPEALRKAARCKTEVLVACDIEDSKYSCIVLLLDPAGPCKRLSFRRSSCRRAR